jgi:hypothetical protein
MLPRYSLISRLENEIQAFSNSGWKWLDVKLIAGRSLTGPEQKETMKVR